MVRNSYLFLALLFLAGCRTPYIAYDCEPNGAPWPFPGWSCEGGYSELELAPDTYQVSFSGKNISTAKSQDYALLRAAELTLEKGQRYFLVSNSWETELCLAYCDLFRGTSILFFEVFFITYILNREHTLNTSIKKAGSRPARCSAPKSAGALTDDGWVRLLLSTERCVRRRGVGSGQPNP